MITLPHVTQQNALEKPSKPEGQVSDGEELAESFLQLVKTAKAGLKPDVEPAVLPKIAVKNDAIKIALEKMTESGTVALPDDLAVLLTPQGKSPILAKAVAPSESTDQDNKDDLPAISALFAMLPSQILTVNADPALAEKSAAKPAAVAGKGLDITLTATPTPSTKQNVDADDSRPLISENIAGRFMSSENPVNLRAADNPPSPVTAFTGSAPVVSTGAPLSVPATPILNAQLGSQEWQQQLSQQVMLFTRQGQQHAELRLHPEHLGKVEISLKLDDNQMQLQIMSPHSQVRAALEAALPLLRTSLSESGVQLSQSQVGGEGSMPQQQTPQQEQQTARQNGTFSLASSEEDDATLAISQSLEQLAQNKGAVDIFA